MYIFRCDSSSVTSLPTPKEVYVPPPPPSPHTLIQALQIRCNTLQHAVNNAILCKAKSTPTQSKFCIYINYFLNVSVKFLFLTPPTPKPQIEIFSCSFQFCCLHIVFWVLSVV